MDGVRLRVRRPALRPPVAPARTWQAMALTRPPPRRAGRRSQTPARIARGVRPGPASVSLPDSGRDPNSGRVERVFRPCPARSQSGSSPSGRPCSIRSRSFVDLGAPRARWHGLPHRKDLEPRRRRARAARVRGEPHDGDLWQCAERGGAVTVTRREGAGSDPARRRVRVGSLSRHLAWRRWPATGTLAHSVVKFARPCQTLPTQDVMCSPPCMPSLRFAFLPSTSIPRMWSQLHILSLR